MLLHTADNRRGAPHPGEVEHSGDSPGEPAESVEGLRVIVSYAL